MYIYVYFLIYYQLIHTIDQIPDYSSQLFCFQKSSYKRALSLRNNALFIISLPGMVIVWRLLNLFTNMMIPTVRLTSIIPLRGVKIPLQFYRI